MCVQAGLHPVEQGPADHLRAFGLALLKSTVCCPAENDAASAHTWTQDALLEKLLPVLDAPLRASAQCASNVQPHPPTLERRARDLVMERLEQPLSVAEMCSVLEVSRRTLQNCIQGTWGMGPLAWVNTLRLNAVRTRLKTAASVTEAATEYGFWHFGHFSAGYHALFGEPPSVMLRRYHGRSH
jgi:AraC family ethanolamine operon transcriptional activator